MMERSCRIYCTVPYFGFKAKLLVMDMFDEGDCTVPYFGFKAKQPTCTIRR